MDNSVSLSSLGRMSIEMESLKYELGKACYVVKRATNKARETACSPLRSVCLRRSTDVDGAFGNAERVVTIMVL